MWAPGQPAIGNALTMALTNNAALRAKGCLLTIHIITAASQQQVGTISA